MKTLLAFFLIFTIGTSCTAQVDLERNKKVKVEKENTTTIDGRKKASEEKLSRVYLYKNSRVKKELKFKTKNNKSKLA